MECSRAWLRGVDALPPSRRKLDRIRVTANALAPSPARDRHGETEDLVGFLGSMLDSADQRAGLVATDAGVVAVAAGARFANGRDLLGQPRGLFFIGCTEFWERISFHAMLALTVRKMCGKLSLRGNVVHYVGTT